MDAEFNKPYFASLITFLNKEQYSGKGKFVVLTICIIAVYPPKCDIFNAFNSCSFDNVRVVIIGQDPFHDVNQSHGLCFSVRPGVPVPPSLRNIYKELHVSKLLAHTGDD